MSTPAESSITVRHIAAEAEHVAHNYAPLPVVVATAEGPG